MVFLHTLPGPLQPLWRKLLYWRFRLFQQQRHEQMVLETVAGRSFVLLPGVFNPGLFFSSEFFASQLSDELVPATSSVLDVGTGSGILAVFAAQWAAQVIAVDANPEAVRCARINALINRVEDRVFVRQGDLFAPLQGERFDLVLFNPPYFKGKPSSRREQAFFSEDILDRFAAGLAVHLSAGGRAVIILSSLGSERQALDGFKKHRFAIRRLAQRTLPAEKLSIFELRVDP